MTNNVEKVLRSLDDIGEIFRKQQKKQQKEVLAQEPVFNPFEFMKNDEMGLSRLIAFLLDPKASHRQSRIFLDNFLKQIDCYEYLSYDSACVSVEKTLKSSTRRHDILIEGRLKGKIVWVMSIENKLCGASDQPKQVADYVEDIKENPRYLLLYLHPNGDEPSEKSITKETWQELVKNKHAQAIDAHFIYQWLDSCLAYSKNINLFIKQFKTYVRENIMGLLDDEETKEIISKVKGNQTRIETILRAAKLRDDLCCHLLDELVAQIENKLSYSSLSNDWILKANSKKTWVTQRKTIYIENQNIQIYLNSDLTKNIFNDWFFGIHVIDNEEITQEIKKYKKGKFSLYWAFYKYLDGDYCNWDEHNTAWIDITNGKLANYIFQEFEDIVKELEENQLLPNP